MTSGRQGTAVRRRSSSTTPRLKKLGRQKDIRSEQACKQTGIAPKLDLKDAKQNPDAVFRLAKVLEFIDSAKAPMVGTGRTKS
ncbi:hypothetical protein [Myxococcus sp. AB056]|uniref:hypothetical protein n=1 Tax=Myxococcus sp. AB056 TaxID=2562792 RepID=UPI0011464471|nr:hypothetical protein [Myxococcus sp. AB056]